MSQAGQPMPVTTSPDAIRLRCGTGHDFNCDWAAWQPRERCVLTVLRHGGSVLLIHKKQGFGAGKVSVPGGRIEAGETPLQAAIRETEEEVGLTPRQVHEAGVISFAFTSGYSLHCTIFTASEHGGALRETPEAAPFWCRETEIPYGRMWSDDRLWLPLLFAGRHFRAWFIFEDDLALWHQLVVTA